MVPLLVARCDEETLDTLANDVLATPLPELLRESLPACMVLILAAYTEQSKGGGEREEEGGSASDEEKQQASNSHDLLTKILTEEVNVDCISCNGY